MEHVRVGEQDVRMIAAKLGAMVGSGIPVIDRSSERCFVVSGAERSKKDVESLQLISAQSFDRKKIEGPLLRVLEECFRDGQIVNEGFAACGWGGYHDVVPRADAFEGLRLVFVEAAYAEIEKGVLQDFGKRLS